MNLSPKLSSNFAQLQEYDQQLLRLGLLAERYFPEDPNTCLLKLRQLAELLLQHVAISVNLKWSNVDGHRNKRDNALKEVFNEGEAEEAVSSGI